MRVFVGGLTISILTAETIEKFHGLELQARAIVDGVFSGGHRSLQRGFSVEFADYRAYTAGDDLRYVDWKVFARRDRLYVKQFETETDFQCHLVLDVSPSMTYRSEGALFSKWGYAQLLAAAFSVIVTRQQDRVGVATLAESLRQRFAATASFSDAIQFLEETAPLAAIPGGSGGEAIDLGPAFHALAESLPQRGVVLVFSDCLTDPESLALGLRHLKYGGHDVGLFHIVDPAEEAFPFDDPLLLEGLEGEGDQRVDARWLGDAYRAEFREFRIRLEETCRDHRIHYAFARTDLPPEHVLRSFLGRE